MIIKPDNSFREFIKNLKPQDIIYLGAFVPFLGIVAVTFYFSTQFLTKNINKVFYSVESTEVHALDTADYNLIAKKLNIVTPAQKEAVPNSTAIVETGKGAPTEFVLDKNAINITIKNSTTKKGGATALAKLFEDAGFKKPITGNESKSYATTTILLTESQKAYESLLLEIVHRAYPSAVSTTAVGTSTSDVTVIIGTH